MHAFLHSPTFFTALKPRALGAQFHEVVVLPSHQRLLDKPVLGGNRCVSSLHQHAVIKEGSYMKEIAFAEKQRV